MKRVLTLVWLFVNACILITLIGAGNQIVEGLALTYFGVRPIGWVNTFLRAAWFCLVVPVYLVGFGVATWRLVGERERRPAPRVRGARQARPRSDFSTFSIIVTGVMSVGLYGWVFFVRVAPELGARTQRDVWPAAIELATFDVCAIETRKDWLGKELAFGRIAFEVVNRSPFALHEARFTVSGGRQYQYTLASLAPGEARRVEVETDLGRLLSGGRNSPVTRWSFRLLWDRVRFDGATPVAIVDAPAKASSQIGDCPRFDVRGQWNGDDGSVLVLKQVGTRVSGDLRDGPFSSYGSVLGEARDGTFSGTLFSRSGPFLSEGTFDLAPTRARGLEGTWIFTTGVRRGDRGAWTLSRSVR